MNNNPDAVRAILRGWGFEELRIERAIRVLFDEVKGADEEFEALLKAEELCEQLRTSSTTLWRINPPHHIVGARKRYRLSEVLAFMQERLSDRVNGGAR